MSKIIWRSEDGKCVFREGPYTVDEEREFYARQTPKRMHRNLQQTPQEPQQKSERQEPEDDDQGGGED